MARWLTAVGAFVMACAVALGAYAAHAVRHTPHPDGERLLHTATTYMLVHGLGIVATGLAAGQHASRWLLAAGALFAAGIALFCGSLWMLALTGVNPGLAPYGGTCFIAGWIAMAVHAVRTSPPPAG